MRHSRLAISGVCQTFMRYRSHTNIPTTKTAGFNFSNQHEMGKLISLSFGHGFWTYGISSHRLLLQYCCLSLPTSPGRVRSSSSRHFAILEARANKLRASRRLLTRLTRQQLSSQPSRRLHAFKPGLVAASSVSGSSSRGWKPSLRRMRCWRKETRGGGEWGQQRSRPGPGGELCLRRDLSQLCRALRDCCVHGEDEAA